MSDMTIQNAIYCMKAIICEEVCEDCDYYGKTGTDHCEADAVRMAIKALEEQLERKKGKWTIDEELRTCYCSNCLGENAYAYDWNVRRFTDSFCPNCGADMRGDRNGIN